MEFPTDFLSLGRGLSVVLAFQYHIGSRLIPNLFKIFLDPFLFYIGVLIVNIILIILSYLHL